MTPIALLTLLSSSPVPVAVIPIVVSGASSPIGSVDIVEVVQAEVDARVTLRLVSREELFVAGSGLQQELEDCGTETACIASRLRVTRARLVVVAVVNQAVTPPLVSVELLDVDVITSLGRQTARPPDAASVTSVLREQIAGLLDSASHPPACRLQVVRTPDDATVVVGAATPDAHGRFLLAPGPHEIVVSRVDHGTDKRTFECSAGADTSLEISLVAISDPLSSPWFWGVASAVVVAGVLATVLLAQPDGPCICAGPPGAPCDNCP